MVENPIIPQLRVDADGFVRANGLVIGRRIIRQGEVYLQVIDRKKSRTGQAGLVYLEIPLLVLIEAMQWDWDDQLKGV